MDGHPIQCRQLSRSEYDMGNVSGRTDAFDGGQKNG